MIYFVLPAYNEERNISAVLGGIRDVFANEKYRVILIDDGSEDNTKEIAIKLSQNIPIHIVEHRKNLGLGRSLKDGLLYLLPFLNEDDVVITMDADNTHPVEVSKKMIKKMPGYEIVIASRYSGGAEIGVSLFRRMLSKTSNLVLGFLFHRRGLRDYTSGYRLFRGNLLKKLYQMYGENIICQKGFGATTELLLRCLKFKPKICEVPLPLRYDLKKGRSKMRVLKEIFSYLRLILGGMR